MAVRMLESSLFHCSMQVWVIFKSYSEKQTNNVVNIIRINLFYNLFNYLSGICESLKKSRFNSRYILVMYTVHYLDLCEKTDKLMYISNVKFYFD